MKKLNHILLVEDEEDIQTIAKMTLEMVGGYNVSLCNNGQEFIDNIKSINPDLVILDVMMPLVDGPTAFSQLTKKNCLNACPVIFMTAKNQPHEVEALFALGDGVVDVIAKPFDPVQLVGKINDIWNKIHG